MSLSEDLFKNKVIFAINSGRDIAICPYGHNSVIAEEMLHKFFGINHVVRIDNYKRDIDHCISVERFLEVKDKIRRTVVLLTAEHPIVNASLSEQLRTGHVEVDNIGIPLPTIYDGVSDDMEFAKTIAELLSPKMVVGKSFTRVGGFHDGGYVLLDDFQGIETAYSFGIGDDISWDIDVSKRDIEVFMFDHTVSEPSQVNSHLHYFRKGICHVNIPELNLYRLDDILTQNGHMECDAMILKMDVEGAEYASLMCLSNDIIRQFKQVTIELHDLCKSENRELIIDFLRKMNITHQAVWIHGNNIDISYRYGEWVLPNVLEVNYVRKKDYEFTDHSVSLPMGIDVPNNNAMEDIDLSVWFKMQD